MGDNNYEQEKQLARTIVELEKLEEKVNYDIEECDKILKGGML